MPNIFSGDYTFEDISVVQINEEDLMKKGKTGEIEKLLALHHLAYSYYCEKQEYDRYILELEKNMPLYAQSWMKFFHVFASTVNSDKHFAIDGKVFLGKNELRKMKIEGKKISDLAEEDILDLELMFSEYSGQLRIKERQFEQKMTEITPRLNDKQALMVRSFFRNLWNIPTRELERAVLKIIGEDDFTECSFFRDKMIEIIRECMLNFYLKVGHDFVKQSPASKSYVAEKIKFQKLIKTCKDEMRRMRKRYNEIGWMLTKEHPELSEDIVENTKIVYRFMMLDVLKSVERKRVTLNKGLILETRSFDDEDQDQNKAEFLSTMLQKKVDLESLIARGEESVDGENIEDLIRILWANYKMAKLAA